MTDPQQKDLLAELLAIREGMATKADLAKLEEGLTGIIIKLAESAGSATQTASAASEAPAIAACLRSCAQTIRENRMQGWESAEYITAYALTVETHAKSVPSLDPARRDVDSTPTDPKDTPLRKEINRLTERVDRLSNWYQELRDGLTAETGHCIEHHNRLKALEERSATQTEQPASAVNPLAGPPCGVCGKSLGAHVIIEHKWVPTPATEPPAQDSTKTNPEKPCDQ